MTKPERESEVTTLKGYIWRLSLCSKQEQVREQALPGIMREKFRLVDGQPLTVAGVSKGR